jgi:hypothetical protein
MPDPTKRSVSGDHWTGGEMAGEKGNRSEWTFLTSADRDSGLFLLGSSLPTVPLPFRAQDASRDRP